MDVIKEKIKDILGKFSADKKTLLIVLAGVAGVIILVISELVPGGEADRQNENGEEVQMSGYNIENHYEYAEMLEEKLTDIISSVDGAGKTKVMLTLESSSESVYAKNDRTDMESDEEGGGEKLSSENNYVLIKTDSSQEEALLLKIIQPEVKGVAVVCEGGDSIYVQQKIIEIVSAVFDINSSKIKVTKLSSEN